MIPNTIFHDHNKFLQYLENDYDNLRQAIITDPRSFLNSKMASSEEMTTLINDSDFILKRYKKLYKKAIVHMIYLLNQESTSPDERITDPKLLCLIKRSHHSRQSKNSYVAYINNTSSQTHNQIPK